jgi:antitoxin YefM
MLTLVADAPGQEALVMVPFFGLGKASIRAYAPDMQTLPVSKVKDKLNELVEAAARTHEQITITKNGSPAAVLVGIDEWESLQETLFWLSQPGILESIAEAKADVEAGRVYSEEQIRAQFNVPKRDR